MCAVGAQAHDVLEEHLVVGLIPAGVVACKLQPDAAELAAASHQHGEQYGVPRLRRAAGHHRVRALDRVNRLLLVLFLLLWWLAHLAATCIHHGKRARYDRTDRRDKGIFRIGRLYLFDIERRDTRGGNIQQCLLFRKNKQGWCFSLRF